MITCKLKSPTNPDLFLPLSSASSRMKLSPAISSISVVVPNGVNYASEINNRLDGYLELYFEGIPYAVSDRIDSAPLYEGASSSSVQINATGLFPAHTPLNIDLTGVSFFQLNVNGDVRIRATFNPLITPSATVNYDGVAYLVDSITYSIAGDRPSTMELFINA